VCSRAIPRQRALTSEECLCSEGRAHAFAHACRQRVLAAGKKLKPQQPQKAQPSKPDGSRRTGTIRELVK